MRNPQRGRPRAATYWAALVTVATALSYAPALDNGFTNWDDPHYVTGNDAIRVLDADAVGRWFVGDARYHMGNYHPLTMASLALDRAVAGDDASAFVRTNVLLHLAATLLVFALARALWREPALAGVAALVFGVHPAHVESVAWISARKDVLYAVFYLTALLAWIRYREHGVRGGWHVVLVAFVAALLSKAQAVTLPVALVAIDWFRGRSLADRKVWLEKAPLFALSVVFGLLAIVAQQSRGALASEAVDGPLERLLVAGWGLVHHASASLLPLRLSAIYPHPARLSGELPVALWLPALLAPVLVAAAIRLGRRDRGVAFAFAFFGIHLALVLQWIPVGGTIAADRYVYVASFGYAALCALAWKAACAAGGRRTANVGLAAYVALLIGLTRQRVDVWQDSFALWNDVIARRPTAATAWNNRGAAFEALGDCESAVTDFSQALGLDPSQAGAWRNRAGCRFRLGDLDGARADYDRALALAPDDLLARRDRSQLHRRLGDLRAAIADLDVVLAAAPADLAARLDRSEWQLAVGETAAALAELDTVVRRHPRSPRALALRSRAREASGDLAGALADADAAVALRPDAPALHRRRGDVLERMGDRVAACSAYRSAEQRGDRSARDDRTRACEPDGIGDS